MKSKRRVLATSKITRHFQVTVSKYVREHLDCKIGDIMVFVEYDGKMIIEKA